MSVSSYFDSLAAPVQGYCAKIPPNIWKNVRYTAPVCLLFAATFTDLSWKEALIFGGIRIVAVMIHDLTCPLFDMIASDRHDLAWRAAHISLTVLSARTLASCMGCGWMLTSLNTTIIFNSLLILLNLKITIIIV